MIAQFVNPKKPLPPMSDSDRQAFLKRVEDMQKPHNKYAWAIYIVILIIGYYCGTFITLWSKGHF